MMEHFGKNGKNDSKLQMCRQNVSLKALYFGGWLIDSATKGKCCRYSCNFGFSRRHHYKGVKPF